MRKERGGRMQSNSMPHMAIFLERIQIEVKDLDKLNVIHVSGSKGKGSVCAFSESILRHCGLKTGFYSSPHLVEARERFRINGLPIHRELFGKYFFEVWDRLVQTKDNHHGIMPPYFRFLTLLGFHIFLQEQVDCAVVEVGIGGLYDCTNIVKNPVVCGIASIGLEHQSVLGETIEEIARHKAGIMKPGHPAITIPQLPVVERVLQGYAEEIKTNLSMTPPLQNYDQEYPALGLDGKHQEYNASLALQLCRSWLCQMNRTDWNSNALVDRLEDATRALSVSEVNQECNGEHFITKKPVFPLPAQFKDGLKRTKWPGRNQMIHMKKATLFLDGAHTPESLTACAKWFITRQSHEAPCERSNIYRILMFNVSGSRDPYLLLPPLMEIDFDAVIFCPSVIYETTSKESDTTNYTVTREMQLGWCELNNNAWLALNASENQTESSSRSPRTEVIPTVSQAIDWLPRFKDTELNSNVTNRHPGLAHAEHVQLLVTGSIHLIGCVMKYLNADPMNAV